MTLTISVWMIFPALLIAGAIAMFVVGSRQSGMLAGLFEGLVGFALLAIAGAFLLGRWLS